jgi:hypothetical protein
LTILKEKSNIVHTAIGFKMKCLLLLSSVFFLLTSTITAQYNFIAVNNIKMWICNNGEGSHSPDHFSGFFWPGGKNGTKTAVFSDGLIIAARVGSDIRIKEIFSLQGGKIINEKPDNPALEKYRVYKITRGWENFSPGPEKKTREKDYMEWPIEDGAPYEDVNGDGRPTPGIDKPRFLGDETLWCVSNDFSESISPYYSEPMGLEIQTTVFGYKKFNILNDVVFKKYIIINKGTEYLTDMFFSYFSDPDIGSSGDDYAGCDTILNLGYVWNSNDYDAVYGTPPPAVGYSLLQGPLIPAEFSDSALFLNKWVKGFKNLPMTAFAVYFFSVIHPPENYDKNHFYNIIQGKTWYGSALVDPNTNDSTYKILAGDPESGTGWYEGDGWISGPRPGDRRFYLTSGPFNLAPGDTQEIAYAIHVAKWRSNAGSVTYLKEQNKIIREFYISETLAAAKQEEPIKIIPTEYVLEQNYPNPFNPATTISYQLPVDGYVTFRIYDMLGSEVVTLVNEYKTAGSYFITWNAENLAGGVYFYTIESGGFFKTKKMMLLK